MERETKTIETPVSKQKVEILTYITGGEKRVMNSLYIDSGISVDADTKQVTGVKSDTINKGEDHKIQTIVISVDGKKNGQDVDGKPFSILAAVLSMRSEDFDAVIKAISEVTGDAAFEEKKTS